MSSDLLATKHSMIENIFEKVRRHYQAHKLPTATLDDTDEDLSPNPRPVQNVISDELLSDLFFLFQTPLEHALDLIDKEAVTRLVNRVCSGHFVFQVTGSSGATYTCFAESNYCTCPFYKFSVLRKEEFVMCKHSIAARLSLCLDAYKDVEVTPAEIAKLLLEI